MPTRTPAPSSTPTDIPTPSATPIPLYSLSGIVFFDYNGSGEKDLAYGIDSEESVMEPGIPDVPVCLDADPRKELPEKALCTVSDKDGNYVIENVEEGAHKLYVKSPTDDPATAFKYINISHGWVDIPAYEINEVQVPAQHLPDTEIKPIGEFQSIRLEEDKVLHIALMQGWLSLDPKYRIYSYYDLDPRNGYVRNYECDNTVALFPTYRPGTFDQHTGIDFECNYGENINAFAPGKVIFVGNTGGGDTGEGSLAVEMVHSTGYTTHVGHVSKILVSNNSEVKRGQLIALCGSTGCQWPHIHFQVGDRYGNPVDPYQDIWDTSNESFNLWIRYNNP